MNAALFALLQVTASFLIGIEHNPQATPAMQEQAVAVASRVIQIGTQAVAEIPFTVPQNNSAWPNIEDVMNAPYRNAQGGWAQVGQGVQVISSSTSFGDLNNDGLDDAVVLVEQSSATGPSHFALAALLNQGGILFNIADVPLGTSAPDILSHSIQNGEFVLATRNVSGATTTTEYMLLGNSFSAQ